MMNLRWKFLILLLLLSFSAMSCTDNEPSVDNSDDKNTPIADFDLIKDNGQYWHPEMNVIPKALVTIVDVANKGNSNNSLGTDNINQGLQAHLIAQSTAGIINRAVQRGECQYGVWLQTNANSNSYNLSLQALANMGIDTDWSLCKVDQVATNYSELRPHIKGYVLTDIENNPESAIYAAVASHVYSAIIVDVRDEAFFSGENGEISYKKLCDATDKSTIDAWRDFKDKCNNKALVIMPVQTGQLREFAITNDLFVINLNKKNGNSSEGQNVELFEEVLQWLEPNSPIYGWEQGVGEDAFVGKVSEYGHMMIPYDWAFNTSLTSLNYKARQKSILAKGIKIQSIDFDSPKKKYVSFYLSDGDNIQWMMNNFEGADYYTHPSSSEVKMGFGVSVSNLSMIAPAQFENIMNLQDPNCSIIETFAGGYYYVDTFGKKANRDVSIARMSNKTASHMRQHRVKILGLIAMDLKSADSRAAYQKFISANDQLDGIITIQYTPYAGGEGEIMWFTNSRGIDIPVVSAKYSVWNFGANNHDREGSPTYIANKIKAENGDSPFSLISMHAWSRFTDIGASNSETNESTISGGTVIGSGAAKLCADKLGSDTEVVTVEEMIWRIRMHYRPEQTQKLLSQFSE